uniref:Asn/Gln amidotransferase domain-containing protein n=1 Tax=Plectus sambesii TaxID=2011161 RepID=A0A914UWI8_9BILA
MDFSTEALPPKYLVQLATLEHSKRITRPTAKWVMKRILTEGETLSPLEIVEQKTLWRISDPSEIAKLAETAVKSNAKTIQLALEGRPKHLQKLRNALLELSDARIDIEETVKAIQVELQKHKK